ncbi:Transposase IS4 [Popillia japonica]|uniref:Transposase IS4 n=1 Tax=Popillia japonica TaxID=7064 RepID=A0AAW1I945_POPJA
MFVKLCTTEPIPSKSFNRRSHWKRPLKLHEIIEELEHIDDEINVPNDVVSGAMSRNRFRFVMQNLHCSDNNKLNPADKFSKVRPLFKMLNKRFIELAPMKNIIAWMNQWSRISEGTEQSNSSRANLSGGDTNSI